MFKTISYPLFLSALLATIATQLWHMLPAVADAGYVLHRTPWVPNLNMDLAFRFDGLSLLFGLMISGVGALIFFYSAAYMRNYQRTGYFFTVLFLFALSMLGLVLADHFMVLFIFWELTTITSYLLIGYNNTAHIARRNALQALLVTGGAGLVLFSGLVWLGVSSGSFYLSDLLASPGAIQNIANIDIIFILIFIGCIAKSAQMPFHFWLPNAMAAPTPVSAYLHSATMVKAGIYLLARLQPAFGELELWTPLLGSLGAITAVWASMLALTQKDLKLMLAYTTLMALGVLTFLLAFPTEKMAVAAMVFLVVHALYKAPLFLVIGIIDQAAGTRQTDDLSGLKHKMALVWFIALLAGLSMAGIPTLFGFIAKELQYEAAWELGVWSNVALFALIAANALMICAAFMVAIRPFRGEASEKVAAISTKPSPLLWLPPAVLAISGLVFGINPGLAYHTLIELAANDVAGSITSMKPAIWHGITPPLLLSVITVCFAGIGLCALSKLEQFCHSAADGTPSFEALYFKKLDHFKRFSLGLTKLMHSGSLEGYSRIITGFVFTTILITIAQHYSIMSLMPSIPDELDWIGLSLSILAVIGAFYAIRAHTKIMALAALGASGFAMAGIFLLHGALDVAMTQLLVETLFVILAAALLWRIPETSLTSKCHRNSRYINVVIAIVAGISMTCVMMVVLRQPLDLSLTHFFEQASFALAHGRNIVNVILVDFRAFDTFGEVMVVAAAALGLWGLMRSASSPSDKAKNAMEDAIKDAANDKTKEQPS